MAQKIRANIRQQRKSDKQSNYSSFYGIQQCSQDMPRLLLNTDKDWRTTVLMLCMTQSDFMCNDV